MNAPFKSPPDVNANSRSLQRSTSGLDKQASISFALDDATVTIWKKCAYVYVSKKKGGRGERKSKYIERKSPLLCHWNKCNFLDLILCQRVSVLLNSFSF